MKKLTSYTPAVARWFLGLVFTVFGANGFFHFMPMPPEPAAAVQFLTALTGTGYFIPLEKITEIVAGLALLSGTLVPLALVVLAPIVVNITAFHLFLAPSGLPMAILLIACEAGLAWHHRQVFAPLFARQSKSSGGSQTQARVLSRAA